MGDIREAGIFLMDLKESGREVALMTQRNDPRHHME